MNCPNCGFNVSEDASFCPNCGYRFDDVSQNEPIRIVISPLPETQSNVPPVNPTVIVEQPPAKSSSNGIVIFLTVLVTLLLIGATAIFGYIFLAKRSLGETVAANSSVNTNSLNVTVNAAVKPSPTTYEDLKNKIAPPDKSTQLIDEEFSVAAVSHRAVPFSITSQNGATLAGGFRVIKGKFINFYVYPAAAYEQYPTNGMKPVHLEQTRNKILNERLKTGDYYLVFENNEAQLTSVAAELLLVDK